MFIQNSHSLNGNTIYGDACYYIGLQTTGRIQPNPILLTFLFYSISGKLINQGIFKEEMSLSLYTETYFTELFENESGLNITN